MNFAGVVSSKGFYSSPHMIEFLRTSLESEMIAQGAEIANFSGSC